MEVRCSSHCIDRYESLSLRCDYIKREVDLSIHISDDELQVAQMSSLTLAPGSISFVEYCGYQYAVHAMYVSSLWFDCSTRLRGTPDEMLRVHAGAEAKISIMHACSIAASGLR